MKAFQPFHIVHIDTYAQMRADTILLPVGQNTYAVLWWKNIPLCHLFLPAALPYSREAILDQLFTEFKGTLSDYARRQNLPFSLAETRSIWLEQQQLTWNTHLQRLCAERDDFSKPAQDISVIICTRNRAALLRGCLEGLQQQVFPPKEIIVVDNAPLDESTRNVTASFINVRYCLEETPGLDHARNTGAKAATTGILAYTDDDVLLHPLWTYYIAGAFAHNEVMGVTGLIFAAEIESNAQFLFEKFWSFNRGYIIKDYGPEYFKENLSKGVPVWEIGAGANMAFRKEIFERVGYFDERLDAGAAGCNGDSEFWYRILAEGYRIRYVPLAIAYHKHRREMKALKHQIFFYMRGFTTALYIQHEKYRHKGNLDHLYRHLMPFYITRLPRAFRHGFQNNFSTYLQELGGIFSGLYYYHTNRKNARPQKADL